MATQDAQQDGATVAPVKQSTKTGPPQQKKKKKKNDPARPQPAWLFPPDELNPVLNPKVKTAEEVEKEITERMEAIKFLKHKATNTPMRTQPPSQLLQLVAAFLAAYGFNSTGRIFTLERRQKITTTGWEDEIGKKFEKGMPDLVKIHRDWSKEWESRDKADDTSSSGEGSESESSDSAISGKGQKIRSGGKRGKGAGKEGSSATSDSDGDSESTSSDDSDRKPKSRLKKVDKTKKSKPAPKKKAQASSDSSSSSTSDNSDSNSSEPNHLAPLKKTNSGSTTQAHGRQNSSDSSTTLHAPSPEKTSPVKASKPSDTSSSSSSDSSDGDIPTTKNEKELVASEPTQQTKPEPKSSSETSSESSNTESSGSSSGSSESEKSPAKKPGVHLEAKPNPPASAPNSKRKRSPSPSLKPSVPDPALKKAKKNETRFSRIPADTKVDPKLASNAYVPYDYANRAHQDLIVTKGKGFTKEKNKKKRGS